MTRLPGRGQAGQGRAGQAGAGRLPKYPWTKITRRRQTCQAAPPGSRPIGAPIRRRFTSRRLRVGVAPRPAAFHLASTAARPDGRESQQGEKGAPHTSHPFSPAEFESHEPAALDVIGRKKQGREGRRRDPSRAVLCSAATAKRTRGESPQRGRRAGQPQPVGAEAIVAWPDSMQACMTSLASPAQRVRHPAGLAGPRRHARPRRMAGLHLPLCCRAARRAAARRGRLNALGAPHAGSTPGARQGRSSTPAAWRGGRGLKRPNASCVGASEGSWWSKRAPCRGPCRGPVRGPGPKHTCIRPILVSMAAKQCSRLPHCAQTFTGPMPWGLPWGPPWGTRAPRLH